MKFRAILVFSSLALLCSCGSNSFDVDVSKVNVSLDIQRFDQAIALLDKANPGPGAVLLAQKYGAFAELYSVNIIKVGSMYNADYPQNLKMFLSYEVFDDINEQIVQTFGKGDEVFRPALTNAFKHFKYYFPIKEVPVIYTFNGGFNQSVVIDSAMLGIGLDKYLGSSVALYKRLEVEQFKKSAMIPAKIAPDCMQAIFESEFPFNFATENLLSSMIHEGRKMYFVKAMIPDLADTTMWGFTTIQMDFCGSFEGNMWSYLVDNKLLFDSDYMTIKRFTSEGPFTTAFSKDSPARAASWIGFRIVCSYMEHNPGLSLQDLLAETDYQKIMNKAKYNP